MSLRYFETSPVYIFVCVFTYYIVIEKEITQH